MLIYRMNRIPDKLHVALMELLGITLEPPTASVVDLRFRLAKPPTDLVHIPAGRTEVGTLRVPGEDPIVFQTTEDMTIRAAAPAAYAVERARAVKDVGVAHGVARPKGPDQLPFGNPPQLGDALYLGFDESLARMMVRIDVECSQARGAGVDPEDPPLKWEVSVSDAPGGWMQAQALEDTTGGFNYGSGVVELQLPTLHDPRALGSVRSHWIRCRVSDTTRHGNQAATFSQPPEIYSITAAPIGALVPAEHSVRIDEEDLPESDGTAGQVVRLRYAPVLPIREGEGLEVLDPEVGAGSAGTQSSRSPRAAPTTATTPSTSPAVRSPSGRRCAPARGAGASTGPCRPRARGFACRATDTAAGDAATCRRGRSRCSRRPSPDSRRRDQPAPGDRRRRRREPRRGPPAGGARDPHPVSRGDGRRLRLPAPGRVAPGRPSALRGAAQHGRRGPDPSRPAHRAGGASAGARELIPDDALFQQVSDYLDERRLVGTRVEARAGQASAASASS